VTGSLRTKLTAGYAFSEYKISAASFLYNFVKISGKINHEHDFEIGLALQGCTVGCITRKKKASQRLKELYDS
jgi:hypothetical protein